MLPFFEKRSRAPYSSIGRSRYCKAFFQQKSKVKIIQKKIYLTILFFKQTKYSLNLTMTNRRTPTWQTSWAKGILYEGWFAKTVTVLSWRWWELNSASSFMEIRKTSMLTHGTQMSTLMVTATAVHFQPFAWSGQMAYTVVLLPFSCPQDRYSCKKIFL